MFFLDFLKFWDKNTCINSMLRIKCHNNKEEQIKILITSRDIMKVSSVLSHIKLVTSCEKQHSLLKLTHEP